MPDPKESAPAAAQPKAKPAVKAGDEVIVRHLMPGPFIAKGRGRVESVNEDGTLELSVPSSLPRANGRATLSGVIRRNAETERGLKTPPCPRWWPVEDEEPAAEPEAKKK